MLDNYFSSYYLSGIVIDSFVYEVIDKWYYLFEGVQGIYNNNKTFEEMLFNYWNQKSNNGQTIFDLLAPGSKDKVDVQSSLECLGKVLKKMAQIYG